MVDHEQAHREHGLERSGHWPTVRKAVLESQLEAWRKKFPGFDEETKGVEWEVHHRIAFHFGALLGLGYIELDVRNLYVIPRHSADLHLLLGHLDDFRSFNVDVIQDLKRWGGELWGGHGKLPLDHDATKAAITSDPGWLRKHLARPRSWNDMTEHDKRALAHLIRTELPLVHQEVA